MAKGTNMNDFTARSYELQQTNRPKQIDLLTAYKTLLNAYIHTQRRTIEPHRRPKSIGAEEDIDPSQDQGKASA